jgi:uncharacterized membrane protein
MWLSYALFSALFLGVRRIYEKQLSAEFGNFSLSFVTLACSLPFTLTLFFFLPVPHSLAALPWRFWWPLLIIWLVLYPVQNYFLYRSLREGELSEVVPVGSLLPVFNIGTSLVLLGEVPSLYGDIGIALTVIATYLLLTDTQGFRGQVYNKPVLFMVLTVCCTAVGSTLDKIAIESSTPVFYSFVNVFGASVVFLVLSYFYGEHRDILKVARYPWTFVVLGVVLMLGFTAAMFAFSYGPTSYVLALRSAGFLLAAFWGVAVLKESMSARKAIALGLFVLGTLALALG